MNADTALLPWTFTISLSGTLVQKMGCWTIDKIPVELRSILDEIEKALAAEQFYLAIAVTLSIPDICSSLEFDPEKPSWANRRTYVAWCLRNVDSRFKNLTGDDLYNLRGGIVHRGSFEHQKSRFARIMFLGPKSAFKAHDTLMAGMQNVTIAGKTSKELRLDGDVLLMGVVPFCRAIMDAARDWVIAKADDPIVRANLPLLVRYRPEGLPPFSIGIPTVA